jgi:hypothetical protein
MTLELGISPLQAKNVTGTPVWLLIDRDINGQISLSGNRESFSFLSPV